MTRVIAITAFRRQRSYRRVCPDPFEQVNRPTPSPACCWTTRDRSELERQRNRNRLLKHALQRCVAASGLIGGRALVVNAVDDEAAAFWARRGFLVSRDNPLVSLRSIADIATFASLGEAVFESSVPDLRRRSDKTAHTYVIEILMQGVACMDCCTRLAGDIRIKPGAPPAVGLLCAKSDPVG